MKMTLIFYLSLIFCVPIFGQELTSGIFQWEEIPYSGKNGIMEKILTKEGTMDLKKLQINGIMVPPSARSVLEVSGSEKLIIVKQGLLSVTVGKDSFQLGPSSTVVIHPGESLAYSNSSDKEVEFLIFEYAVHLPVNLVRAKGAGGSFAVDFDTLNFQSSDAGGRRQNFDRPTAMFHRFEMHVSTLNAGLTNHQIHTHRAEEMVLMVKGQVKMNIGEEVIEAQAGDLLYLASEIPHNLINSGQEPTEYFAFQWVP